MYIIPGYTRHYEKDGAIFVTSKLKQNTIKLTDSIIQEEFHSIVKNGGCKEITTPLTQFLYEQELLMTKGEVCQALQEVKALLNDTLMITIMPTEGCNFRCTYCYEDHKPVSMTRYMIETLKNFIIEKAPHFKHIHINWFGGEPTLCKDTILEVSSLIQSLQKEYDLNYTSSMTTNGYILDESYFREFYEAGITCYQITIDGHEHDKTRPHVSGKGTLKKIIENLMELKSLPPEEYSYKIIIRHNILAGDRDFSWYDYLYNLFGTDERFIIVVRSVNDWGGEDVEKLSLLSGESKESLLKEHEDYIKKLGMKQDTTEMELFGRICYAAYPNGYIFRSNGRIEKCSVTLNYEENTIGYIDDEKGIILDRDKNKIWHQEELKAECYTCPDVLSCLNLQCRRQVVIDKEDAYCHYNY